MQAGFLPCGARYAMLKYHCIRSAARGRVKFCFWGNPYERKERCKSGPRAADRILPVRPDVLFLDLRDDDRHPDPGHDGALRPVLRAGRPDRLGAERRRLCGDAARRRAFRPLPEAAADLHHVRGLHADAVRPRPCSAVWADDRVLPHPRHREQLSESADQRVHFRALPGQAHVLPQHLPRVLRPRLARRPDLRLGAARDRHRMEPHVPVVRRVLHGGHAAARFHLPLG